MKKEGFRLVDIIVVIVFLVVLIFLAVNGLRKTKREEYFKDHCFRRLERIETAKNIWALQNNKAPGDTIDQNQVNSIIKKRHKNLPECRSGGKYTYENIGKPPSCSIHGKLSKPVEKLSRTELKIKIQELALQALEKRVQKIEQEKKQLFQEPSPSPGR